MTGTNDCLGTIDGDDPGSITAPFFKALSKIESTYEEHDCDDDISADARKDNSTSKSLACACVITLCKILDNIILERKYNPKTRSIKLSNKLFKDKVGKVLGGGKLIQASFDRRSVVVVVSLFCCSLNQVLSRSLSQLTTFDNHHDNPCSHGS